MTNRAEVNKAPIQTSRQDLFASGKNSYIEANKIVTMPKENKMSRTWKVTINDSDRFPATQSLRALRPADSTNETSKRKPTAKIRPKENIRSRISFRIFCFGLGSTSHILLRIC